MNESTSFNETQPIKQSANYTMFNNPNEEDQSIYPQINSNSTYMKIAIKYKLPPNFSSVFKISKLGFSICFTLWFLIIDTALTVPGYTVTETLFVYKDIVFAGKELLPVAVF